MDIIPDLDLASLNPFVRNSVGENEIWAENSESFCDIESINQNCFEDLNRDILEVAKDSNTRLRFVIGAPGTGKSHVFARFRRSLEESYFTLAPLLPTETSEIKRYILNKVIWGLKHSFLEHGTALPYSQIARFVYSLLTQLPRFRGVSIDQMHKDWQKIDPRELDSICEEFQDIVFKISQMHIPFHVPRVLFRVLDDKKRKLALEWLSGNTSLSDKEYSTLEVTGPIDKSEIMNLLKAFGKLFKSSGPIVLILDQLDALTEPEQIREIETLLMDLKDNSENWYIVISLLEEKFELWRTNLSEPCLQRFHTIEAGKFVYRTSHLSMITRDQQIELLKKRLAEPSLDAYRKAHHLTDDLSPFTEETLQRLSCDSRISPRALLQLAEHEFHMLTTRQTLQPKPLDEFVESEIQNALQQIEIDKIQVDTAFIADRIKELMELINQGGWKSREGPLKSKIKKFDGIDRIYEKDGERIRIINYDIQQGAKFPTVLKHIIDSSTTEKTILVRDARIPYRGQKTQELIKEFKKSHKFVHLCYDEVKKLHALGHFLAKVRERDYETEYTEPQPTEDNILRSLSHIELINNLEIMTEIKKLVEGKQIEEPEPEPHPISPPDLGLSEEIEKVMQIERWLSYERLFVIIYERKFKDLSKEAFSTALRAEPLCTRIDIYPKDLVFPEHRQILIWNQE